MIARGRVDAVSSLLCAALLAPLVGQATPAPTRAEPADGTVLSTSPVAAPRTPDVVAPTRPCPADRGALGDSVTRTPRALDLDAVFFDAAVQGRSPMLVLYRGGCAGWRDATRALVGSPDREAGSADRFRTVALDARSVARDLVVTARRMSPHELARALGTTRFPAYVTFDARGRPLQRVEAPVSAAELRDRLAATAGIREALGTTGDAGATRAPGKRRSVRTESRGGASASEGREDFGKPVAVIARARACGACEAFDEVLSRRRIRVLLEYFDVLRLDVESAAPVVTPDGRRLEARDWLAELRLDDPPAILLIAPDGLAIARAHASDEPVRITQVRHRDPHPERLARPDHRIGQHDAAPRVRGRRRRRRRRLGARSRGGREEQGREQGERAERARRRPCPGLGRAAPRQATGRSRGCVRKRGLARRARPKRT